MSINNDYHNIFRTNAYDIGFITKMAQIHATTIHAANQVLDFDLHDEMLKEGHCPSCIKYGAQYRALVQSNLENKVLKNDATN